MKKNKSKKEKPKTQEKKTPPRESETNPLDDNSANPYGGIPDRDLKKNLGCG